MPKIIEEARETILQTAKQQLFDKGYAQLTIRGVAAGCGMAVGTIYNYFENKDVLIAHIMVEDWAMALADMEAGCREAETVSAGVLAVYRAIDAFSDIYRPVWNAYPGGTTGLQGYSRRHVMLRGQIGDHLEALVTRLGHGDCREMVPLLAETVLAAAMQADIQAYTLAAMTDRLFPA